MYISYLLLTIVDTICIIKKKIKEMFLKRESNLKVKFRKKEIFEILLLNLKSVSF